MRGAPLTVAEARVILRADEALDLTYEARVAAGTTFSDEDREAWMYLVGSANDRIAAWGRGRSTSEPAIATYPGGNAPDFQTLAMEAAAAPRPESEAEALRSGIETILRAFGTNSAEWAQQFRSLLDRVPRDRRTA